MSTEYPSKRRRQTSSCPDCGFPLLRRNSRQTHPLLRRIQLRCDNDECGAAFVAHEELVCRLSPPSSPNPDIHLPTKAELKGRAV